MGKKRQKDPGRCQINLKDPNTIAFLDFFSGRKSEVIQAALEQYMQTDNRHTRELRQLVNESVAQITRAQEILGVESTQAVSIPVMPVAESPRMSEDRPEMPFDLGGAANEDEEIFGDIDI